MIGVEMVGFVSIGPARALGLGVLAFALAACASLSAPLQEGRAPFSADTPPRVLDTDIRLQCVPYARNVSGVEIFGDANTWWRQAQGRFAQSRSPASGSVMVLRGHRGPNRGHVAVVTEMVSRRIVRVDHANWLNHGEISVGVPVLDVSDDNDWSEVRVWHIPGGHWGGRIYRAEGFIHPFQARAESPAFALAELRGLSTTLVSHLKI